jgi:hypothetical protein
MQFDYAMAYPLSGIKDTFGTHRASLMFKFGPVIRGSVESGELVNELTEERSKRVKAERELAAAQKELAQMKRDFNELLRKPSSKKIPVTPLQRSVLSSNAAGETKKAAPVVTSPAGVSLQSSVPVRTTDAKKRVQPAQQRNENEYTIEYAKYRRNALRLSLNQRIDRVKAMIENYKGLYPTLEAEQEYRVLVTEVQAQRKYYNDAMTYHKKMVNRGLSGKEQIAQLRRIIDKYKNKTDTSEAERAYAAMTGDLAVQQKNYDDSLNYFKKMASSGISIEEQIDLVQRILRKYENTAVNVSEAREQLQKLKDRK